jgi:hypothetical protein
MLLAGSPLVRGTRWIALKLRLFLTKIIGAGQEKSFVYLYTIIY